MRPHDRGNFTLPGGVDEPPPIQGEFYALSKDWMPPLRLSVFLPMLVIVA